MGTWTTVAPGVHQHRGGPFDLSVVVIEGGGGLLVVDTGADPIEAADLLAEIATRFPAPVRWVVNTHRRGESRGDLGEQVGGLERIGARVDDEEPLAALDDDDGEVEGPAAMLVHAGGDRGPVPHRPSLAIRRQRNTVGNMARSKGIQRLRP